MFDELYNKAKKHLIPQDKTPVSQPTEVTPATPAPQASVILPKMPMPTAAPKADTSAIAQTTLTREEQATLLRQRKSALSGVLFLKYSSLLLVIFGIVGLLWVKADLDVNNNYLSILNATDNTGSKYEKLTKTKKKLEQENLEYSGKISRIQQQLATKNYSIFTENIQNIQKEQLHWFDSLDENGVLSYGILDGPRRASEYFNSDTFSDPILSNTGNNIIIGDVSADRESLGFGVKGSHLFGKAFFLNSEFVSLMNAFPIYKDGSISSFTKKKDENGNQSMDFVLRVELQNSTETDPNDAPFIKYENWIQENSSSQSQ